MARPRIFDRDQALKAAMSVFWAKGYEASSTDDLLRAMGIGRQSLYDTFGDKHRLYLEALKLYNSSSLEGHADSLGSEASPLAAIEQLLLAMANETDEERAIGCMGINAICEFGQSDPDVAAISRASNAHLLSTLESVLLAAKEKDEVADSLPIKPAANFLGATLAGLKVRAKAGDDRETLQEIAAFALNSLRA